MIYKLPQVDRTPNSKKYNLETKGFPVFPSGFLLIIQISHIYLEKFISKSGQCVYIVLLDTGIFYQAFNGKPKRVT